MGPMLLLIVVLVILAALGVLGFVIKGLLWLGLVAVVLFVVVGIAGWIKGKSSANR